MESANTFFVGEDPAWSHSGANALLISTILTVFARHQIDMTIFSAFCTFERFIVPKMCLKLLYVHCKLCNWWISFKIKAERNKFKTRSNIQIFFAKNSKQIHIEYEKLTWIESYEYESIKLFKIKHKTLIKTKYIDICVLLHK